MLTFSPQHSLLQDIYVKVNRDYIVNTAKTAKSAGCTEFYLLSGMSVDPKSRFFHMRIKVGHTKNY